MKYFTMFELIFSETALARKIKNETTRQVEDNLIDLVDKVLDPLRARWGKPLKVNSGYRCPRLNAAVGGVITSQHTKGEAVDVTTGTEQGNKDLVRLIMTMNLPVDQVIFENTWVHISHRMGYNRKQFLQMNKIGGKTVYSKCDLK